MSDMTQTFGAADERDIEAFEAKLGTALPAGYRRFLLRNNGGKPVRREFEIPGWGSSLVHVFFGFKLAGADDLEWNLDVYDDLMSAGVIAIGTDPGGNRVCLGVLGKRADKVFFWDHESGSDDLIQLADSFDGFLSGLAPDGTFG